MTPRTYKEIGIDVGVLVEQKNKAYGSSFEKSEQILKALYPDGVPVDKYKDMLCLVRIIDKMFRIATDKDALGESPYQDIAGYAILGIHSSEREK